MINFFKSLFRKIFFAFQKEKWYIVGLQEIKVVDQSGEDTSYRRYIYLYESSRGNRRCQVKSTEPEAKCFSKQELLEQTDFYLVKVYPWLQGAEPDWASNFIKPSYPKTKDKNKDNKDKPRSKFRKLKKEGKIIKVNFK